VSLAWKGLARWARRAGILVAGLALIMGGAILLVLPGPGIALILAGLAVLATEFRWARRLLTWARERAWQVADRARRRAGRSRGGSGGSGSQPT
jgi:uncharacterized protein (TIGR02611 family)